jgi:hypothetical protein
VFIPEWQNKGPQIIAEIDIKEAENSIISYTTAINTRKHCKNLKYLKYLLEEIL